MFKVEPQLWPWCFGGSFPYMLTGVKQNTKVKQIVYCQYYIDFKYEFFIYSHLFPDFLCFHNILKVIVFFSRKICSLVPTAIFRLSLYSWWWFLLSSPRNERSPPHGNHRRGRKILQSSKSNLWGRRSVQNSVLISVY